MLATQLPTDPTPLLQGQLPPLREAPWSSPEAVVEGGNSGILFPPLGTPHGVLQTLPTF